jgi:hypothetical protein
MKPCIFANANLIPMKKSVIALSILFLTTVLILSGCSKKTTEDPCNGKGVLSVENKLDSAISVKIEQTHNTMSIDKDFTLPFPLAGNQPYTLTIDGPNYHKDTTLMILFCDNKLFIVTK